MIEIDTLRTSAESLLLGENYDINTINNHHELNYSISYIKDLLNLHEEFIDIYKYELRVRVALHYSPINAIKYETNNSKSRTTLIYEHINKYFVKDQENAKKLSESIATVLNNWDIDRNNKYKRHEKDLLKKPHSTTKSKSTFPKLFLSRLRSFLNSLFLSLTLTKTFLSHSKPCLKRLFMG